MAPANRKLDTIRQPRQKVENKAEPLLSILEPVEAPASVPVESAPIIETKKKKEKPKKVPKAKAEKPKRLKVHHKIGLAFVFIFLVAFAVISIAGAAYAHQQIYANKVYPGVKVWGEDVGGKTMSEVQEMITDKIKNFKVTLNAPSQNYTANAEDLGLVFNSESMALSAYSQGRTSSFADNYITRVRLLGSILNLHFSKDPITQSDLEILPSYTVDQTILDAYIKKLTDNININATDSQVKVENGTVKLVPAIYGREVDTQTLKTSLMSSIQHFSSGTLEVKTNQVAPKVIDNSVQEVMTQADAVMAKPVTLTYKDQKFTPDKETVGSWLTFQKPVGAQTYSLVVEPKQMDKYFAFLRTKLNIYSVPKKISVKNGVEQTVTQEGKDGLLIDEKALGQQIAANLPSQPSVTAEIPMYVSPFKTEYQQVLVANWDKYIDVNLSTQTMTAYLKGGQLVGSWKVTTGNRYHPTPVGTWLVTGKTPITRMTGGTRGIDYYDLPNVHWVTWFKGDGYSIHEAYWRSTFGGMDYVWNGSHGCVNATYSLAKFIYDWAPVGTPVIIHK